MKILFKPNFNKHIVKIFKFDKTDNKIISNGLIYDNSNSFQIKEETFFRKHFKTNSDLMHYYLKNNNSYFIDIELEKTILTNKENEKMILKDLASKKIVNDKNDIVYLSNTITSILKNFIYSNNYESESYINDITKLLFRYYTSSYTVSFSLHIFKSSLFKLYYDNFKLNNELFNRFNLNTKILLFQLFAKVGFQLSIKDFEALNLQQEIDKNKDGFYYNNINKLLESVAISDLSHNEKEGIINIVLPYIIKNLKWRHDFGMFDKISIFMSAYYISICHFANDEYWSTFFDFLDQYISARNIKKIIDLKSNDFFSLNNHDVNQICNTLNFLDLIDNPYFKNLDKKYKSYFFNLFNESIESKAKHSRQHNSFNLKGKGLQESLISHQLSKKYKVETQIAIMNLYDCDFLIDDKVIMNINGPSHYCLANINKLNHKTQLKTAILEHLNYKVLNINLTDFTNNLKNTNDDEISIAYFSKLIDPLLNKQQ